MRLLRSIIFSFLFIITVYPQVEDRLRALDESQVNQYVEPMSLAIGLASNLGTYTTAEIPSSFAFSIGFTAPVLIIPKARTTFVPDLPSGYIYNNPTATVFGNEGGYYAGPQGYIVYPPGINRTTVPAFLPQVTASAFGTRLLLRYLPWLDVGETKVENLGIGLSHSISQYFPALPVDLAVQGLYSSLKVKDIAEQYNFAFNVHGSKEFGVFTLYSGVQYEQSSMDLNYTFRVKDPENPNEFIEQEISASLKGNNNFRFTLGGSVKLAIFRIHGDINLGPLFAFNQGLTIEF